MPMRVRGFLFRTFFSSSSSVAYFFLSFIVLEFLVNVPKELEPDAHFDRLFLNVNRMGVANVDFELDRVLIMRYIRTAVLDDGYD